MLQNSIIPFVLLYTALFFVIITQTKQCGFDMSYNTSWVYFEYSSHFTKLFERVHIIRDNILIYALVFKVGRPYQSNVTRIKKTDCCDQLLNWRYKFVQYND